jgi:hypothetical protein
VKGASRGRLRTHLRVGDTAAREAVFGDRQHYDVAVAVESDHPHAEGRSAAPVATPPAHPVPDPMSGWRRRFASIEAAALAGIVCAIGWSVSFRGLLAGPSISASPAEIARHYAASGTGLDALVLLQIATLATLGFMWFIGVVRGRLGDQAPAVTSTVFIGAGILIAGLIFAGLAALAAPAVLVETGGKLRDPGEVSITRAIAISLLAIFTPRVATLVMFSTASLGRVTKALPRWLIILTYVVGAVEFLNVTINEPTIYVFPAWIALVSLVVLVRKTSGRLDDASSPV